MSIVIDVETDTEDEIPQTFSPWQNFILLQRSKKWLYITTGTILLISLIIVILLCISVSRMHEVGEIVLAWISIALSLVVFASGIVQVGIYKEKDIIVSM